MKSGLISKLKSRMVPNIDQKRTIPLGLYKGLRLDMNLGSQTQVYLGLWERETYRPIKSAATRASWFVDVGAGRGELCVYFAKCEHVKKIIAIEPSSVETSHLRKNMVYNIIDPERVDIIEKFVGNRDDDGWIKLDQLAIIPSHRGFIKIDVDGFELDVLQGAHQLLKQGRVELLIETHSVQLEKDCVLFLETLDYSCRIIDNAWWRTWLPEHRPIEHNRWFFAERR